MCTHGMCCVKPENSTKMNCVCLYQVPSRYFSFNTEALDLNSHHFLSSVVISQTHWLVSRVRLARWRESLCLLNVRCCHLASGAGGGSNFMAGVSHHTPPPPGGAGLYNQF